MTLHREVHLEDEICADLAAAGCAAAYDRARTLFPADLLPWVQATQPAAWAALSKNHGAAAEATLLDRLCKSLDDRGTLDVLRHGVELLGLRQPVALAQFKPALAMTPTRWRATAPTGCAWCGSCAIRCTTTTPSTWYYINRTARASGLRDDEGRRGRTFVVTGPSRNGPP